MAHIALYVQQEVTDLGNMALKIVGWVVYVYKNVIGFCILVTPNTNTQIAVLNRVGVYITLTGPVYFVSSCLISRSV